MEIKEVLNVLKEQLDINTYNFGEDNELPQALSIAINSIENIHKASELILEKIEQFPEDMGLYTRGLYDGYYNSVNIINSITKQS